MIEEFRIIEEFPKYEVSNFGRVRNFKSSKLMSLSKNSDGYYHIQFCKNGKFKTKRVHRLVAETFIPNIHNKSCIDHINNDKNDNNVLNLRWVSIDENCMNRSLNCNNKSNFKGVNWYKSKNKWNAQIQVRGKKYNLGYFDKIEDAVNARVKKAKELFGDYINSCEKEVTINLNIPANIKVNINIKPKEDQELEELEKEFNDILKAK